MEKLQHFPQYLTQLLLLLRDNHSDTLIITNMKTADLMNTSLLSGNSEIILNRCNKLVNIVIETCPIKDRDGYRVQSESSSRVRPVAESQ